MSLVGKLDNIDIGDFVRLYDGDQHDVGGYVMECLRATIRLCMENPSSKAVRDHRRGESGRYGTVSSGPPIKSFNLNHFDRCEYQKKGEKDYTEVNAKEESKT